MTEATKTPVMVPDFPLEHVWYQRWRPSNLDNVVLPAGFKTKLLSYVENGRIPSLCFYSPSPGTGKTTAAWALCNYLGIRPLFINASMNNDVETIRTRVLEYATTMSLVGGGFKVVILDEGERLSSTAQDSLKGLMEQVSKHCSFIITTNSKTKIVEPLLSRCDQVDFIYNSDEMIEINSQIVRRAMGILEAEGVPYDLNSLVDLVKDCAPDNRKVLVRLQSLAGQYGEINNAALQRMDSSMVSTLVESLKRKDFKAVNDWCMENYERFGDDIYGALLKGLRPSLQPQSLVDTIATLNDYQRYHNTVPDRYVHALAMCTTIMLETKFV
ncbi:gp44 clamp-loader subunit [Delftia phage PhiW-14]|uniref:Sliding-clamp-loader large subunit n=1 Tax=Delftia phage PhiW-14 TaxID=665032 RepID=C9DGI4_BPW14|nr:clamp loader of DNA polymerase [Delftia phage PhiW-14]ACV50235.1 gp44 clamp-loader subunit [Delftia phage PhiW-14]